MIEKQKDDAFGIVSYLDSGYDFSNLLSKVGSMSRKIDELVEAVNAHEHCLDIQGDRMDKVDKAPSFESDIEFLGSRLSRIEKRLWGTEGKSTTDPYKKRDGIVLGLKDDSGKARWDLLPLRLLRGAVRVLGFGAKKYGDNNWQTVDNPRARYYAALQRHLEAWQAGLQKDVESGESHLDHAMCCLLFLRHFEEVSDAPANPSA